MRPKAVWIDPATRAQLEAAAVAALPDEFVALLGGTVDDDRPDVDTFVALDAQVGRDCFAVQPPAFARAEAAIRASGRHWLGFVHSHPNGAAVPSLRDRRDAWPHCVQLVVGAATGRPGTVGAFWFDQDGMHTIPLLTKVPETAP
ncbi:MAG: Mov34/MPN/PAD-1 family protein [Planctomycetes bacterium]|nr:Mov34/MPN/PAD-1 family protein [Planctomycetota bacterium]